MAVKKPAVAVPKAIVCACCGASIPNAEKLEYPTDCVVRDNRWLCWDCVRKISMAGQMPSK